MPQFSNITGQGQGSIIPSAPTVPQTPAPTSAPSSDINVAVPPLSPASVAAAASAPALPTSGTGIDNSSFLNLMNNVNVGFQQNNQLIGQKKALINMLFPGTFSQDQTAPLTPDMQAIANSGDKNQIQLAISTLADASTGNAQSLSSSIQYLTQGYEWSVQNAETQKQDAFNAILNYAKATGKPIGDVANAISAAYGVQLTPQMMTQLQALGTTLQTTNQVPSIQPTPTDFTSGNFTISIPASSNISAENNNPLDLKYAGQQGATQGTDGFAKFDTPEAGFQAGIQLIQDYQNGTETTPIPDGTNAGQTITGNSSLEDFIRVYAPTSDGNNPVTYAQNVAATLGVTPQTPIGQIDPIQLATAMLPQESNAEISSGNFAIDASAPDPKVANVVDQNTGLTPNAIYESAIEYMYTKSTPALGLGSAVQTRNARTAIQNKAAAIASLMGLTYPQLQALYKADSSTATQIAERIGRMETVSKTLAVQFPRLSQLADEVKAQGINITESDLQSTSATIQSKFGGTAAASYIELINTMRGDYSAMLAAFGGGRGGQTYFLAAQEALPIGLTGEQYMAQYNTIQTSIQNASGATTAQMQELLGVSGGVGSPSTTSNQTTGAPTGTAPNFSSMTDDQLQAWIQQNQ